MSNEVKLLIGIGAATLAIVIGAAFFVGGSSSPTQESAKLTEEQMKKLVPADSHQKGNKDAKVTLVEFGDFQCPACGMAHPVVNQLIEDYKDQINFVYREYPLASHQNARVAAHAAEAAGAQGKFFEMYDALFQNQKEWSESKSPMEQFESYAQNIGLDVEQFKKDVSDKKYEDKINRDISDGNTVGVRATPTFFLNGEEIRGGLPYDSFKAKIDEALAK
jgi:protein-disulfide isomerase